MDPETRAVFLQLGQVLTGLTDRIAGGQPEGPSERSFSRHTDFIPSYNRNDSLVAEELRHKHQLQFQQVDWCRTDPPPDVAGEPKRTSSLTTITALKSLPMSAVTWCNDNCFDISTCNAQKNLELWARQFPGEIVNMLLMGTYDDAVRGNSHFTRRMDHIVELSQRANPGWNSGLIRWTHHGVEYTVTQAFLTHLENAIAAPNGMRACPWGPIHPNDANFPVPGPAAEYNDLGCYDASGPAVVTASPQEILHNSLEDFLQAIEAAAPLVAAAPAPGGGAPVPARGFNRSQPIFSEQNMHAIVPNANIPAPYFTDGITFAQLFEFDGARNFVRIRPFAQLLVMLPSYVVDDPKRPPPCPCNDDGKPLVFFDAPAHGAPFYDDPFLLLAPDRPQRQKAVELWWKTWHAEHPFRAPPPVYVQYNSTYCPERAITRHEFNVFDLVIGTLLKTFAEKKKVRAHDLDCMEAIRQLKPSKSYTKDIADKLRSEYPEDTTSIISDYKRLFERAHEVYDGERMLPQYLINYLNEINQAIEEIGKPADIFSRARTMDIFSKIFEDAYFTLSDHQRNDDFFRELQKLAKRFRKLEDYPPNDRLRLIIESGIEKIYAFLLELSSEHKVFAARPAQLTFIPQGSPAQAEYNHMLNDALHATLDDDYAPPDDSGAPDVADPYSQYIETLIQELQVDEESAHQMRVNMPRPPPRLANTGLARGGIARGGVPTPLQRDPGRGRGPAGRGRGRRGPDPRERIRPYWDGDPPRVSHPHSSFAGGGSQKPPPPPDGDREHRRQQLKALLAARVPPPLTSQHAVVPGNASAKPAQKPGFPRKASGKLVFPGDEYKTLSELRKAYESFGDASSTTDPKVKQLLSAASGVANLLHTHDQSDTEEPTNDAPAPIESHDERQHRALDKAVDDVLAVTDTQRLDFDTLARRFDASYLTHARDESLIATGDDLTVAAEWYEQTVVNREHIEHCKKLATALAYSIVLFDSCATRCFEKNMKNCIPGTYMELVIKPTVKQASTTTQGQGLALRRYNILLNGTKGTTRIVMSFIAPVMIVPSFTENISISSMNELAHLGVIIKGAEPPELPSLLAVNEHDKSKRTQLQLELTPSGMPYFICVPDEVVDTEGWTRLNTNYEPYDDRFAIERILANKTSLLTHHLMHENLKVAYEQCFDRCLTAFTSADDFADSEPVPTKTVDARLTIQGVLSKSS